MIQNTLARVVAQSLGTATLRQFWPVCTGSLFARELTLEIPSSFDQHKHQGGHFDPLDIFANISQTTKISIRMSAGHF